MPRIIVTTDPVSSELTGTTPVLLDEHVHSVHLSTGHAAAQLVERLAWAISDAEHAERARPATAPASHPHPHGAAHPPADAAVYASARSPGCERPAPADEDTLLTQPVR